LQDSLQQVIYPIGILANDDLVAAERIGAFGLRQSVRDAHVQR